MYIALEVYMNCNNCSKAITRGRWCSDKCRKEYARKSDKPGQNESRTSKVGQKLGTIELTPTDKLFQDDAVNRNLGIDWLDFTDLKKERCLDCGTIFETHLSALRFCSPVCKGLALNGTSA